MALNPTIVKSAFFDILKSDTAGAAVRLLLGAGANSVIHAEDMRQPLPAEPFIVLRAGAITGAQFDVRQVVLTWWIYDSVLKRFVNIDAILPAIEDTYTHNSIAFGRLTISGISQEIPEDAAVGKRPSRSIQYTYTTRR